MEMGFPTPGAFIMSFEDEKDRCLSKLSWRVTPFPMNGKVYQLYSRDSSQVAVGAMESASDVCIEGSRRRRRPGGPVTRTGALDSDLFLDAQREVLDLHHHRGRIFTLGVQLFSDTALISWLCGSSRDVW